MFNIADYYYMFFTTIPLATGIALLIYACILDKSNNFGDKRRNTMDYSSGGFQTIKCQRCSRKEEIDDVSNYIE